MNKCLEVKEDDLATDFLIFSYFGIRKKDFKEDDGIVNNKEEQIKLLVATAINRAFRDAASHVLKTGEKNEEVRSKGANFLLKNIDVENMQNVYDLIKGLQNEITEETQVEEKEFTVGISQKWVNMTYKYIYILDKLMFKENLIDDEDFENNYEIPIDRYIISAAGLGSKPWSTYDICNYDSAKEIINKKVDKNNKFEWENTNWMEKAINQSDSTYKKRIREIIDNC